MMRYINAIIIIIIIIIITVPSVVSRTSELDRDPDNTE